MRIFEHRGEGSHRFWTIELKGKVIAVTFGRIGTKGRAHRKTCSDKDEAKAACDRHARRSVLVLMALVLAAGCSKPPPVPSFPEVEIKGRVADADGKALGGVNLRFVAHEGSGKISAVTCRVKADGTFFLRALPRRYKVTVSAVPTAPAGKDAKPAPPRLPEGVPEKYGSAKSTPWEVEIPAGGKLDVVLEVQAP